MESTRNKIQKPFADKAQRDAAFGPIDETTDPLLVKLSENVLNKYGTKMILTKDDWLACHKEEGQNYEQWLSESKKNEVNKEKSKIYLNIIDTLVESDFQHNLLKYCKAFFTGMDVILIPPEEGLMEKLQIESRINEYSQEI